MTPRTTRPGRPVVRGATAARLLLGASLRAALAASLVAAAGVAIDAVATPALAQAAPAAAPNAAPVLLPQTHPYQRTLRAHMAKLTAKDFDHGITGGLTLKPGSITDPDVQYRNYIYTLQPHPLVGTKRAEPAVNAPPVNYTLPEIETPEGVKRPHGYSEATVSFLQWNYPGNPFFDSRALKMRCFVESSVNLMMLDAHLDKYPLLARTDRVPYWLVRTAAAYPAFKPLLPREVQAAYEDGLRRLAERVLAMEPKGEEPNLDLSAPVGLIYADRALGDPELSKRIEAYGKRIFTDPAYVHPAGYWVERGGQDISFSGTTNYFAVWAALMTDWPFARATVDKVYRLRTHLMLPEPGGSYTSPTAMSTRTGGTAHVDQWNYANRDHGAAMLTDHALCLIAPLPTPEQLAGAGEARATIFNAHLAENPPGGAKGGFMTNDEIRNRYAWGYSLLPNYNFPASVNPAHEFYRKGSLARLQALTHKSPALFRSPYDRGENFVRDFGGAFIIARRPAFAAILHLGPVGAQNPADGKYQFGSPLGFGGGQLAAFWTPKAGSAIQNRRAGQAWQTPFDLLPNWRNWPIHAVSGLTSDGRIFTSARITKPAVTTDVSTASAKATVSGPLVAYTTVKDPEATDPAKARDILYDAPLSGRIDYARSFTLDDSGVRVETTLSGDGKDTLAELFETIPVLLKAVQIPGAPAPNPRIEFLVGGAWSPATDAWTPAVQAFRASRYDGSVVVTFESPRRVKLSPAEWVDTFITRDSCRNVVVDLLDSGDKPGAVTTPRKLAYRVASGTP